MKTIIFNSGLGKRMGKFTKTHHKSMAILKNGESIFERQIRILSNYSSEFVVTTGPFKEQLIAVSEKFQNCKFHFVNNPIYDKTNYIYSMFQAIPYLDDDCFLLHGDLVFNEELVKEMLNDNRKSICLVNEKIKLPRKDFKGRVVNGKLKEVSINIFDNDCFAFQPLYKLSRDCLLKWCFKVEEFVNNGNTLVYAENALNEILNDVNIYAKSYEGNFIDEIDTLDDYARVTEGIEDFEKSRRLQYAKGTNIHI